MTDKERPFDYIFVVAHGASPSSKMLADNLKSLLSTLNYLKETWFWELKLKIHVELIDLKSVLFPLQNNALARLMPTADLRANDVAHGSPQSHHLTSREDSDHTAVTLEQEETATGKAIQLTPSKSFTDGLDFDQLLKRHGHRIYIQNIVGDVICYTNPRYGNFMVSQLQTLINRKIDELQSHPSGMFKTAEIVFIGHSLGSVLMYELLTGHACRETTFDKASRDADSNGFTLPPLVEPSEFQNKPFSFRVKKFFMWGSPLSAFLLMRPHLQLPYHVQSNQSPFDQLRIYNIFHRQDPIALRLEPMLFPHIESRFPPPVILPSSKTNRAAEHLAWRQGLQTVLSAEKNLKLITDAIKRVFTSQDSDGPHESVRGLPEAQYRRYVASASYLLPDPLNRRERYGKIKGRNQMLNKTSLIGDAHGAAPSLTKLTKPAPPTDTDSNSDTVDHIHSKNPLDAEVRTRIELLSQNIQSETSMSLVGDVPKGNGMGGESSGFSGPPAEGASPDGFAEEDQSGDSVPQADSDETEDSPSNGTEMRRRSSFVIAKGDAKGAEEGRTTADTQQGGGEERVVDDLNLCEKWTTNDDGKRPFTPRTLALYISKSLRRTFLVDIEKRLSSQPDSVEAERLRSVGVKIVDGEIEKLLQSVIKINSAPREQAPESLTEEQANLWVKHSAEWDLLKTEEACKTELKEEVETGNSEVEGDGGDQLPVRVDFAVTESIQQYIFIPLGLLQSHLNYWSCPDTCFFMLKEVTGFRPRINLERRDAMLEKTRATRKVIVKKLDIAFKSLTR